MSSFFLKCDPKTEAESYESNFDKEVIIVPTIRLFPASEGKSWRAVLDTDEPVHCFKSDGQKLYLVSHRQLEAHRQLQSPFAEVPEDSETSMAA